MATSSSAISRTDFFTRSLIDLPGGPAELVDLRDKPVRPDVALDLVEAVDGEVEPILVLVADRRKSFSIPRGQLLESPVPADPVIGMDDEIPFGELAEGLQEIPLARRPHPPPEDLLPEDLLFGEHDEPHPREMESAADPPFPQVKAGRSGPVIDPAEEPARPLRTGRPCCVSRWPIRCTDSWPPQTNIGPGSPPLSSP